MKRQISFDRNSLKEFINDILLKNINEDTLYDDDGRISDEKLDDVIERYNTKFNCYDNEREFVEMVKEGVIEKLHDWEGQTVDACDLGYDLTECENVNGSWYCSTWKAEQDLSWYFSVFAAYQEWWITNYGEPLEMFSDTGYFEAERIHCCMMIDAYRNMFERAFEKLDDDYDWNEKLEVNEKFIEDISKVINENFFEVEDIF